MPRCPWCDTAFDIDADDEAELDVAYCPECDEPVNLGGAASLTRPGVVVFLILLLFVPPLGVAGVAAYFDAWQWVLGAAGAVPLLAGLGVALNRRFKVARVLTLVWSGLVVAGGFAVMILGVPLILVWGLGLVLIAASIPVIAYGVVLVVIANNPLVAEWCDR